MQPKVVTDAFTKSTKAGEQADAPQNDGFQKKFPTPKKKKGKQDQHSRRITSKVTTVARKN